LQDQLGVEGAQIGKEGPGGQKDDGADDPTVKRPEAAAMITISRTSSMIGTPRVDSGFT